MATFAQDVRIDVNHLKQMEVSCYVKTENVNSSAQLWCQVWDVQNKMINYQWSIAKGSYLTGTNDWTKLTLSVLVEPTVKRLHLGGLLTGSGSAWFDNFALENKVVTTKQPPKQVVHFKKEIANIVRQHSIYAHSINWQSVNNGLTELSQSLASADSAQVLVEYLISKLKLVGDNHSLYQSKTNAQAYSSHNTVPEQPYGKILKDNIGYIWVPAFGSTNDTASIHFAEHIQNIIANLDTKQNIKGWIVDLRKNGGGNMYPMIAGLGPLTGEGNLGYFVHPKLNYNEAWFYKDGKSGSNNKAVVTVHDPYIIKCTDAKIAVLVGSRTGSSGEMTAISFMGKKNTKLFGQNTAGYVTANQAFKLSSGAYLYLATGYVSDRNKKSYMNNIQPDIYVKDNADSTTDSTLGVCKINCVKPGHVPAHGPGRARA